MKKQTSLVFLRGVGSVKIHYEEGDGLDMEELMGIIGETIDTLEGKIDRAIILDKSTSTVEKINWQNIPKDDSASATRTQKLFFSLLEYLGVVFGLGQNGFDIYIASTKVLLLNTEDEKLHFVRESDAKDYAKHLFGDDFAQRGVSIIPIEAW
jgi:hypothetical protein